MKASNHDQLLEWYSQIESNRYLVRYHAAAKILKHFEYPLEISELRGLFALICAGKDKPSEEDKKGYQAAAVELAKLIAHKDEKPDYTGLSTEELQDKLLDVCYVRHPDLEQIKQLVELGADPFLLIPETNTSPYTLAMSDPSYEVAAYFLKLGGDINHIYRSGFTTLWVWNSARIEPRLVELFLAHGAEVDATDENENTALHHIAPYYNNVPKVKMLLDAGANPKLRNKDGETPLYIAARRGDPAMLKLLLELGIDAEQQTNEGDSPLLGAVKNENKEKVALLLKFNADPDLQNANGQSPYALALEQGLVEIAVAMKGESARQAYADREDTQITQQLKKQIIEGLKSGKTESYSDKEGHGETGFEDGKYYHKYQEHLADAGFKREYDTDREILDLLFNRYKYAFGVETEKEKYEYILSRLS